MEWNVFVDFSKYSPKLNLRYADGKFLSYCIYVFETPDASPVQQLN